MKKYLLIKFFIVSCSLSRGLSDDKIKENIEMTTKDIGSQKIINVRNYQDKAPRSDIRNHIGEPMNNLGVPRSDQIRDNLQIHKDHDDETGYNNKENGIFERNYIFDVDAGNPDIHGEIKRPCQVYDTFCIRKFFTEHSKCKISGRPVPDPLYRSEGNYHIARANISGTQTDANYGGLNDGRIIEFYINKATDNLVIAITFENVTRFSLNTYFKFYFRGREPVVTRDYGGIRYGTLTVTVIIPQIHQLNLERSEIYTYGDNDMYAFSLGPGIAATTDPEVLAMYAQFNTNFPIEYQEEITNLGNFAAGNYIQYNICDFGIKVL